MSAAALHSKLAPSGAKIWVPCTASIDYVAEGRAAGKIPEDDSTTFSREGDVAHAWAARVNNGKIKITAVPPEFQPHVKVFTDECEKLFATYDKASRLFIEDKIPLFYQPEDTGTVDYAIAGFDIGIHIRDFKYGKGVYVDAEGNLQLAIYAQSIRCDIERLNKRNTFDDDLLVTLGIVQPRYMGAVPVRIWETTVGDLKDFSLKVADAVLTIRTGDRKKLKFAPSEDTCQFCPARFIPCVHKAKAAMAIVPKLNNPLDLLPRMGPLRTPDASALTDEQLVNVKRHAGLLRQFLDDAEGVLEDRALKSGMLPKGLKWVKGREGNREWSDEDDAYDFLMRALGGDEDKIAPRKLISPTVAGPLLKARPLTPHGEAHWKELVVRAPAKTVLALEEDKRPAVSHDALKTEEAAAAVGKLPVLT
jgi:hypothetical protein